MNVRSHPLLVAGLLAAVVAASLIAQRQATADLRRQAAALQKRSADLAALRAKNDRLLAGRPATTELESLRADHAAVGRLQNEIAAMRRRADSLAPTEALPPTNSSGPATLFDRALEPREWTNAGRHTPAAALETALWAAAGGDLEQLASTLWLAPDTRTKAEALLATLPADARSHYPTPERLIALLAARDVPLGPARITTEVPTADGSILVAGLRDPAGKEKAVALSFRTDGDRWQIVVPPTAVDRYQAMLTAASGSPGNP